ncbi:DUF7604 domain-containing protein [Bifidobacterium cuniculi]|uniref:DUF7604 domain-containing protein n=1 Tax=Bifidobacterium cuniculi TaxID=1688 RepID=UPI001EF9F69B|nr:VWA domain-containing protein [Bifidobacterium cuniculi]
MRTRNHGSKLVALLCALAMVAGMTGAAVSAYGDDDESTAPSQDAQVTAQAAEPTAKAVDAPAFNKQIEPNDDGTYTLSMDVTGKSSETTEQQVIPLDIALVLDVSGSMDEPVMRDQYSEVALRNMSYRNTYYVPNGDTYEPVTCSKMQTVGHIFTSTVCTTWQTAEGASYNVSYNGSTPTGVSPDTKFYQVRQVSTGQTRLQVLKASVDEFLTQLAAQNETIANPDSKVQVTLIKYAAKKNTTVGNDTYTEGEYTYNYSQVVQPLTSQMDKIRTSVDALTEGGATSADYGLEFAKQELDKGSRANAQKMVIFYSDGEPNHSKSDSVSPGNGTGFEQNVANSAIEAAHTLKAAGATIFAIGAMSDANPTGTDKVNKYMNYVSSNFPDATSMISPGEGKYGNVYYQAVTAGTDLQRIFDELIDIVTSGTAYENVTMTDTLSQYAQFTQPDAANFGAKLVIRDAQGKVVDPSAVGLPDEQGQTYAITANPATKTVSVSFPDNYALHDGYRYSLEYTVEPTQKAYDDYASNLNSGSADGAYAGVKGDDETGASSAGQPGFRSNDKATIDYTPRVDGNSQDPVKDVPMPHPVIQVDESKFAKLTVEKHWVGVPTADRPDSILVDISCRTAAGEACTGYDNVKVAPDPNDAATEDWHATVWIPVADVDRTFTVTEHSYDAYYTQYDAKREWNLDANQTDGGSGYFTTVTNYPKTATFSLGNIQVGKTVQGTDTDSDFGFTLNAGEGLTGATTDGTTAFTSADTTVAGPFTRDQQRTGAFDGTVTLQLPAPGETSKAYAFTVNEQDPQSEGWIWDQDQVGVTVTVARNTAGDPEFNADGTVKATVSYTYPDGDSDATDANKNLAAFTNRLKPVSKLPLTGEGGATPLLWLVIGGGLGALALLSAGGVAVWRKRSQV